MARAMTSDELRRLRKDGQRSRLYLAVHKPEVVYQAQVNSGFVDGVEVAEVAFDEGTGSLSDVLEGMTVWVGTTPGGRDLGRTRVRKAPNAGDVEGTGVLPVGEGGDVEWMDDAYLSVVDAFEMWERRARYVGTTLMMDWEVAYTNQHAVCKPLPVLGALAVVWLRGETVTVDFDGSESWVPGSTVTGWQWSAPGSAGISWANTATPTVTYDQAGVYRVSCDVTAANGSVATGHRVVFVFDEAHMPMVNVRMDRCGGEWERGGWEFEVVAWDEAGLEDVQDGALAVVFTEDWQGDEEGSLGPVMGRENVLAVGWVIGESVAWAADQSSVRFTAAGPQRWLSLMGQQQVRLANPGGGIAERWSQYVNPTADAYLWHVATWRSTMGLMMDVHPSGDERTAAALESEADTLWEKLKNVGYHRFLGISPVCDRYGRLWYEMDSQMRPIIAREDVPVVQTVERQDWEGEVQLVRRSVRAVRLVDMAAGGSSIAGRYYSRAPWSAGTTGSVETVDNVTASSQAQTNEMAGLLLAWRNNEFPSVTLRMGSGQRFCDLAPVQYVEMSLTAADTARGIVWDGKRLIPRRVEHRHDGESGALTTVLELEGETSGPSGVTVTPPSLPPEDNRDPEDPGYPAYPDFPGSGNWYPEHMTPGSESPSETTGCHAVGAPENGPYRLWLDDNFLTSEEGGVQETFGWLPCVVRAGECTHKSRVKISGLAWYYQDGRWMHSTYKGGWQTQGVGADRTPVLNGWNEVDDEEGRWTYETEFEPASATEVAGFKVSLEAPPENPDYSREFTFGGGTEGWHPTSGYNHDGELPPELWDWESGKLMLRVYPEQTDKPRLGWTRYFEGVYVKTGSVITMTTSQANAGNQIIYLVVWLVASEEPLSLIRQQIWIADWINYGTWTFVGDPARLYAITWEIYVEMPPSGVGWQQLETCTVEHVESAIGGRRLQIDRVDVINVCGVEG